MCNNWKYSKFKKVPIISIHIPTIIKILDMWKLLKFSIHGRRNVCDSKPGKICEIYFLNASTILESIKESKNRHNLLKWLSQYFCEKLKFKMFRISSSNNKLSPCKNLIWEIVKILKTDFLETHNLIVLVKLKWSEIANFIFWTFHFWSG